MAGSLGEWRRGGGPLETRRLIDVEIPRHSEVFDFRDGFLPVTTHRFGPAEPFRFVPPALRHAGSIGQWFGIRRFFLAPP